WEQAGAFRAGAPGRAQAEPYCIVIPPPNVTGSLHMGHALNNTLQDILCRFERMRGKDVLWQPGMDHAGIATQMVVERQLAERGEPSRRELGREAFLERIWAWKAESGGAIVNQLKRLGASCDWSRERFTMDEGLSLAVRRVFVQLYREGLIYRDKRLVNWDPALQTAISDLEVVQVECGGSFKWSRQDEAGFDPAALSKALKKSPGGQLYYFDYPLVDDRGAPTGEVVTVATTRPETMLGDTGVAVHPDDERYRALVGRRLRLPLVGRLIPIVADAYSDPEKGTGAVKITPAHDFNDFEVGRRHEAEDVRQINILDAEARVRLKENGDFLVGLSDPPSGELAEIIAALEGADRFEARARVVSMMAERGLLARIEPHVHTAPYGDRSGVVIEPWLTDQWYVDAKTLAGPALAAVREGQTRFVPANWEKTYFQWLENIQPWCVSRQLWWGHQIPAWFSPWGEIFVAETEEEAFGAALAAGVEKQIFSSEQAQALAGHPARLRETFRRDEDVLDTWFSSALWPFSTLGWPQRTPELARFYPTSVLVTGFDIIFFWVARMMMMGLHFQKEAPFRDVYIHALVRDEKGAKMSKSKGNVIDPLALIERYGADALRFTLAAMAAQGRDIKLSPARVEGYRNFATKIWNAARFAQMNGCSPVAGFDPKGAREILDRWILGECAKTAAETTAALEAYRFNEAANLVYRFVWNVFCDWHLELAKPVLQGEDGPAKEEMRATTGFVLDQIVKLLHPFMPFVSEALWQAGGARSSVLALAPWPALEGLEDREAEDEIGWIVDLVSEVRSIRSEMRMAENVAIPLAIVTEDPLIKARARAAEARIGRLVRIAGVSFLDRAPAQSVQAIVRGVVVALPLAGLVDLGAERARLVKEKERLQAEIAKIEARLANPKFMAGAKEEAIAENQSRLEDSLALVAKIESALDRLRE
ncbi:MAG TPA: valine--tRNA ligase, partial [Beijerinckiaceae bacterium]|nr:valine--tRNA ligase [Beijerinckiaceae bacterium]